MAKKYTPLRDWSCPSYSKSNGRAASALEPAGNSSAGYTNATDVSNQIDAAQVFGAIDRRRTTISTPVRKRPGSQSR
jgi:hypothetical protein